MPAAPPSISETPTNIYCQGYWCIQTDPEERKPIRGLMHICTSHNLILCNNCRHIHRGRHRKKMLNFTTAPYKDAITGNSTVIEDHINDSGFYCDGPKCDPEKKRAGKGSWAIMSGDRYHCLECQNLDFCSVCIRGELTCKELGHPLLRIRPTYARKVPLTEEVSVKQRQEREARKASWRCGSEDHDTGESVEKVVPAEDVAMED